MNRSHLWKFLFVVFVLVWSITEMLPPTARNLIDQFDQSAVSPDATFNAIVTKARQSESNNPTGFVPLTYSNLVSIRPKAARPRRSSSTAFSGRPPANSSSASTSAVARLGFSKWT
jgi:hypothetical protein